VQGHTNVVQDVAFNQTGTMMGMAVMKHEADPQPAETNAGLESR
jgi:hypothetical protein